MSDRVTFVCNGERVSVDARPDESLLSVLREQLGITSPKDGCAPQGQCGCCTVLVDGAPRVACVTPAARIEGRAVMTVEGLEPRTRDALARAFVATGGSQCGFCTPGIVMRAVGTRVGLDRALAAHLCRCTGWTSVYEAIERPPPDPPARDLEAAARRARLEGGGPQRVGLDVPLGAGGFADDLAPRGALVAVPVSRSTRGATTAAGLSWIVADSLLAARSGAAKVQGRRSSVDAAPPMPLPDLPPRGVRLATCWVEPAYLEPDASWCVPGGEPVTPLANGGAFGGKADSTVARAARELADQRGVPVRVLFAREDVVRLGPKRPPIAASATVRDGKVAIDGVVARSGMPSVALPYSLEVDATWEVRELTGPPSSYGLRAAGFAEQVVLAEGALDVAGIDRAEIARDERVASALLDVAAFAPRSEAVAGARVEIDHTTGALRRVLVRLACGEPLDEIVLRSYAIGATHMALGWVLTEGLAVDPITGDVHDLTIRSFGIIRARDVPTIDVEVLDDPGPALEGGSDAVFAAVAAAVWNALARSEGVRAETFPARSTRTARMLRT